ncbi:MAG TPA: nitroreductase family protein [Rectinemataceae bacterium]|nr:nitroreductase family protein [Rectinemataceae bacterium]
MKSFFETVFHRASVRSYDSRPIPEAVWDHVLRAAMAAPTAVNRQPWEFVVIEHRATLDALAEGLPYAKMAKQAPGAVLVCAVPARANQQRAEYAVLDASAACENILLAADALGLGAVWTAVYPQADRQTVVRQILGVPEDVIPLAFIPIGYPKVEEHPKDKYRPELIHRERWHERERPLDMPPPEHH